MASERRLIDANMLDNVLEDFEKRHAKARFVLTAKAISNVRQIVYAMKTVDAVEVVHGRWIETEEEVWHLYQRRTMTHFRCSQCEQTELKKSNYCPNCGAKMDLEKTSI